MVGFEAISPPAIEERGLSKALSPQLTCVIARPSSQDDWNTWSEGFYEVRFVVNVLWPRAQHYSLGNLLEGVDFETVLKADPCGYPGPLRIFVTTKFGSIRSSYDITVTAEYGGRVWRFARHRDEAEAYGREVLPLELKPYGSELSQFTLLKYALKSDLENLAFQMR